MDNPAILKMRELRDCIRDELKKIQISDFSSSSYGSEKEYTIRGLHAGINGLMLDVSALCKTSSNLVKLTTSTERNNLVACLTDLKNNLISRDMDGAALSIDKLKVLLRPYNIRSSCEREEEFMAYVDELQRKSLALTDEIVSLGAKKESVDSLYKSVEQTFETLTAKITDVELINVSIDEKLKSTEVKRESLDALIEIDEKKSAEIETLLTEAKSHKELIDSFSKRVSGREEQLDKQQSLTEEYCRELTKFREKHDEALNEAYALIESAKLALQYKTAEGLSAAFAEKHKDAASDKSTDSWLTYATLFMVAAILVGVWLFSDKTVKLETIVGRVSLMPLLIGCAWFCAGQYVKQRNLAEDYAYKSVLAKSMVGFSDQLSSDNKKGDEYSHYVKTVLAEIHKDPLRNRGVRSRNIAQGSDLTDLIKELSEIRKLPDRLEKLIGGSEK